MAVFSELLRIKRLREDRAVRATRKAADALAGRKQAVLDAEDELERHKAFMAVEETRLFEEVKGKAVGLKRLDRLKEDMAALKTKSLSLSEAIEDAKKQVPPAEKALGEAQEAQRAAERATAKFEEFVEVQKAEEQAAATAKEDAEVEEVSEAIFAVRSLKQ